MTSAGNGANRAIRKRQRLRVALLIESSRAYGRGLLLGIARYVRDHEYWSIYLQERNLNDLDTGWFEEWQGDGVIARIENQRMADSIARHRIPAVDVRYLLPDLDVPSVRTNDEAVAHLAAEHLLECGFRHFAFCGFEGADYSDIRGGVFAARMAQAGFRCHLFKEARPLRLASTLEYEQHGLRYEGLVADWIARLPKPIALMACNDIRGQQILNACRSIGVKVPDEVAVIGVDNDEVLCELSDPPLSSVVPDTERIGYEAAALLEDMMSGRSAPRRPICVNPTGIVTRRSTDVLAIEDQHIAKAAQFIREHACENIRVKDVLRVVPLSRSTLERRFTRSLGRSPKDEILRVRLGRAKQLLVESDLPLVAVAEKVGLVHAEYFNVIFKKKTGLTPGMFRNQVRIQEAADRLPSETA